MALLRIANLKKSYNITKTQKQEVLKGVNVEFKSGDLVALVGESGCGKSTLINILGGLDTDYTGSVIIKGDFIRDFNEKQMDNYRKKRVGLIFQNYHLISHMSILQNVEIAMTVSDIDEQVRQKRAMNLLRMVGLADYAAKLPSQLSGGQKQRVAIARALANNPTVLLADEPTGALDSEGAAVIMQILKKIAQRGKLVIVVTHSEKVASECNRIVRLDNGVIVSDVEQKKLEVGVTRDKEIIPKNIKDKELGKLAFSNVLENKSRNILVSMGLAIGMAAVLLILCLSSGLTSYVKQIYAEDVKSLQVVVMRSANNEFTDSQMEEIENLSGIKKITQTYTATNSKYVYGENITGSVNKIYVYEDEENIPEILYGSVTDDGLIVNETFAQILGNGSLIAAVGQSIVVTVNKVDISLSVTGIYEDPFSESDEANAYLYKNTLLKFFSVEKFTVLNTLLITAKDVTYVSSIVSDLKSLGYNVQQYDATSETILDYIDLGTSVLTIVGAVSMVISAIMIFIVLYISVSERMKEIGILRAIGARKKDIRKMFVFEAGIIGLVGGVISVVACIALASIINIICYYTLGYIMIAYNVFYYIGGLLVSLFISVLAGISPAIRASELDPVESLRGE